MNQLTTKSTNYLAVKTQVDSEIVKQLPATYQKYALAKQAIRLSELTKADGTKKLNELYLEVIFNLSWGKKADEVEETELDRIVTCGKCYDLILDRYNGLTTEDVKLAFLNGSLEEYGKFYGLGLKTLSDWLKGYSNDEKKKLAMAEYNRLLDLAQYATKKFTEEQKEEIELNLAIEYFNEYKTNGILNQVLRKSDMLCSIYYERLKTKVKIEFTRDEKIEMYAKAEAEYKEVLDKALRDPKVNFNKSDLDNIMKVAKKDNKPFESICHRIALIEYFKQLVESGIELSDLLYPKNPI